MQDKLLEKEHIAPIYEWAFSEKPKIPANVASEIRELRKRIDYCNLRPRDITTFEQHILRLMKAVYWLRWIYEKPNQLQGDQARISRLSTLLRNMEELDMFDDLHLSAYLDSSGIIRQLKLACEQERNRLREPFQLLVLRTLAEIYPFLTSLKLSMSKGSKFMELAGEIDGYITGRCLNDPAAAMANYAERYGFDIATYKLLEDQCNE